MVSKNYISVSQNIEHWLKLTAIQTDNIKSVLAVKITKTQWRVGTGNCHYYALGSPNFFDMSTVHSTVSTQPLREPQIRYFTNSFSPLAGWVGLSGSVYLQVYNALHHPKVQYGPFILVRIIYQANILSIASTEIHLSHTFLSSIVPSLSG